MNRMRLSSPLPLVAATLALGLCQADPLPLDLAGWTVDERRVATNHPWLVLEPVARQVLDLRA